MLQSTSAGHGVPGPPSPAPRVLAQGLTHFRCIDSAQKMGSGSIRLTDTQAFEKICQKIFSYQPEEMFEVGFAPVSARPASPSSPDGAQGLLAQRLSPCTATCQELFQTVGIGVQELIGLSRHEQTSSAT